MFLKVFEWLFGHKTYQLQQASYPADHKGFEALNKDNPILPPYFPLKLKKCIVPADNFFACLEKNSIPNGEKDVARNAVVTCAEGLEEYKKCMERFVGPRASR
ncbi:hypothetical protein HK096_010050 [Nowakowskiella sp. JEL0078]|nr:hypothetical protein HK096_010050 [Nowakowskiella sp. JEL0078]